MICRHLTLLGQSTFTSIFLLWFTIASQGAAFRAAITDTAWSAAFISYVIRQSGVPANAFRFANAHRVYIYDAFAASAAELSNEAGDRLYRACPLTTRPRPGDLICEQREATLADASDGKFSIVWNFGFKTQVDDMALDNQRLKVSSTHTYTDGRAQRSETQFFEKAQ